jgi:hypothetical protein
MGDYARAVTVMTNRGRGRLQVYTRAYLATRRLYAMPGHGRAYREIVSAVPDTGISRSDLMKQLGRVGLFYTRGRVIMDEPYMHAACRRDVADAAVVAQLGLPVIVKDAHVTRAITAATKDRRGWRRETLLREGIEANPGPSHGDGAATATGCDERERRREKRHVAAPKPQIAGSTGSEHGRGRGRGGRGGRGGGGRIANPKAEDFAALVAQNQALADSAADAHAEARAVREESTARELSAADASAAEPTAPEKEINSMREMTTGIDFSWFCWVNPDGSAGGVIPRDQLSPSEQDILRSSDRKKKPTKLFCRYYDTATPAAVTCAIAAGYAGLYGIAHSQKATKSLAAPVLGTACLLTQALWWRKYVRSQPSCKYSSGQEITDADQIREKGDRRPLEVFKKMQRSHYRLVRVYTDEEYEPHPDPKLVEVRAYNERDSATLGVSAVRKLISEYTDVLPLAQAQAAVARSQDSTEKTWSWFKMGYTPNQDQVYTSIKIHDDWPEAGVEGLSPYDPLTVRVTYGVTDSEETSLDLRRFYSAVSTYAADPAKSEAVWQVMMTRATPQLQRREDALLPIEGYWKAFTAYKLHTVCRMASGNPFRSGQ